MTTADTPDPDTPQRELPPGAGTPLVPGPPASILDAPPNPLAHLPGTANLGLWALGVFAAVVILAGLVTGFWPLAVIGLAAVAGVAVAASRRRRVVHSASDPGDVRGALTAQVRAMSGKVPTEVMGRVANIQNRILALLPRAEQLPAGSEDLYILRATALEYLPAALDSYLNLPRAYATVHRLDGGKTPEVVLLEQLTLLESKMEEISDDIARNDSDRLLANGRFLREKFGRRELQAPIPPEGTPSET